MGGISDPRVQAQCTTCGRILTVSRGERSTQLATARRDWSIACPCGGSAPLADLRDAVMYDNPVPNVGRVTVVKRVRGAGWFTGKGGGEPWEHREAWDIRVNGAPTDYAVVRGPAIAPYLTIIDVPSGEMVTSWHVGPTAGDLARMSLRLHPDWV